MQDEDLHSVYHVIVINNCLLKVQCKNESIANEIIDALSQKCYYIQINREVLNVDLSSDSYFEKYYL